MEITDNTTVDTITTLHETWVVSFQFYIALFETGFKSLLRLTNTDTNQGNPGDRILAIFMDSEDQLLNVVYERGDTRDTWYIHPDKLSARTWYNLTVRQDFDRGEFLVRIFIDGEMVEENPNQKHTARKYTNVTVYAGDMHYPPSILGWMDALNVTTGKSDTTQVKFYSGLKVDSIFK